MLRISTAFMTAMILVAAAAHAAPAWRRYRITTSRRRALSLVPEARTIDATQADTAQHCLEAENQARQQLLREWSQFASADRAICVGVSGAGSVNPVYTELMTCLEMARDSEQSARQNAQAR